MSNTNPLRIFTAQEIERLLNGDIDALREQKLAVYNANNNLWDFNGYSVSKIEVEDIFYDLEGHIIDTVALYQYQEIYDFVYGNDIKLFHNLHRIPFEGMDLDLARKRYDLIANHVNELLPNHVSNFQDDINVVATISGFFRNLDERQISNAFINTYNELDQAIDLLIKDNPKPFNHSFLTHGNTEIQAILNGDFYKVLDVLPEMFMPLRMKYINWLSAALDKVKVRRFTIPSTNIDVLQTLSKTSTLVGQYHNYNQNKRKTKYIDQYISKIVTPPEKRKVRSSLGIILLSLGLLSIAIMKMSSIQAHKKSEEIARANRYEKYGADVRLHKNAAQYNYVYLNNGNEYSESQIARDYLGERASMLNSEILSRVKDTNYIKYEIAVDHNPAYFNNLLQYIPRKEYNEIGDSSKEFCIEFVNRNNDDIKSQHRFRLEGKYKDTWGKSMLQYEYGSQDQLFIRGVAKEKFDYRGYLSKYYIGTTRAFFTDSVRLWYDPVKLVYTTFCGQDSYADVSLDTLESLYPDYDGALWDEMKYGSVLYNIRRLQGKRLEYKKHYQVNGIVRVLSNLNDGLDFPLRDMVKSTVYLIHYGTTKHDEKSYVKFSIHKDTEANMIIDSSGYIEQYQQVTVDKEKGIVEKIIVYKK